MFVYLLLKHYIKLAWHPPCIFERSLCARFEIYINGLTGFYKNQRLL